MSRFLVFGSMNYDEIYHVDHIAAPGETVASASFESACGGKGLNQAAALAKAGCRVFMAGMTGKDGDELTKALREYGADVSLVRTDAERTGRALIQVDRCGQNAILLFPGGNRRITKAYADEVLAQFSEGDWIVLQNEISCGCEILKEAAQKKMKIVLNPSPFTADILSWPLEKVSVFFLNETEAAQLTGKEKTEDQLEALALAFPKAQILLTVGEKGAYYACEGARFYQPAFPVKAVDTTAAGDTFTGYFLAAADRGFSAGEALKIAAKAASIAVTRPGASPSIPVWEEMNLK